MKLSPGGLLICNVLVEYEGMNGKMIPNFIPTRWFKPESEQVFAAFKKGDIVEIIGNIKMRKEQNAQYYSPQIIGEAIKPADDKVAEIADAFDAKDLGDVTFDGEDGIPF